MVRSFKASFEVEWENPEDATHVWAIDRNHFAHPMPALAQALFRAIAEKTWETPCAFVNGYLYLKDFGPPPTPPEVRERGGLAVWQEEYLPLTRKLCLELRGGEYAGFAAADLARELPDVFETAASAFRYPTVVAGSVLRPALDLTLFCHEELGEDGALLAGSLLQGFANESANAGGALAELAARAAGLPEVAAAVRTGRIEDIAAATGGRDFLKGFKAFLSEYGWRAEDWSLPHVATWAEEPSTVIQIVARYLDDPEHGPGFAWRLAGEGRKEALDEIHRRLDVAKRPRLQELLSAACSHVAVSEERAMWQLLVVGSSRVPVIALGRKLAAAGVIEEPNDAYFLELEEIQEAAQKPVSLKDAVSTRKLDLEGWQRLEAPTSIGLPMIVEERSPISQIMHRFFFGSVPPATTSPAMLRGNGASAGVVRGRARVIHHLSEAGRLERGEVLVCRATSPPWTPLFAIAGAVVTETGGVLSHSAICAREYAIVCVVGAAGATAKIHDSDIVTVDGTKGTVIIERA